jgi:hypothetical protein
MLCTLLLPDLILPRAVHSDAYRELALPALELVLARSDRIALAAQGYEAWLCEAFGIARQSDWPVAPLTRQLDGGDAASGFWLRADPVHLRATRDGVVLLDASVLAVQPHEAEALVAALNLHIANDAQQFFAPHPGRWYLRLAEPAQITTHPLLDAIGRDVKPLLPAGPQALHWHRMINEIQMLLHAHPINDTREQRGAPAINSIWLWGGGVLPEAAPGPFDVVWSGDALARALAQRAGLAAAQQADRAAQVLESADRNVHGERHLIVLDQLLPAARHGELLLWCERLQQLEEAWFAPLARAVRERRIRRLDIVAAGPDACTRFEITAPRLLRIWRTPKPLARYGESIGA